MLRIIPESYRRNSFSLQKFTESFKTQRTNVSFEKRDVLKKNMINIFWNVSQNIINRQIH